MLKILNIALRVKIPFFLANYIRQYQAVWGTTDGQPAFFTRRLEISKPSGDWEINMTE